MKILKIPDYFLIKDEFTKKSISFLRDLVLKRGRIIAINFSQLKDTRKGDIMVFVAQLEKANNEYHKNFVRIGSLPKNKNVRKNLELTGGVIHHKKPLPVDLTDAEKASLVDPIIIDKIVLELKKIGFKEYYSPFNVFLTEIIGNAVEHGINNRKINWWLTQEIDQDLKQINYTFVDMGHGIIDTHKKANLPIKYLFLSDKTIVLDALYGKLGSSTKQPNRGKGLPQLRKMIENEIISDFVLITNKVTLKYNNGFLSSKNPNFVGTYFSWSINKNNFEKWMNKQ